MYGDAGYGAGRPGEWPHSSHTRGQCIDIWPMRKPGVGSIETTIYRTSEYDGDATFQFAQVLANWGMENQGGGRQAFFNDPRFSSLGFRNLVHHDDHLHVCFRDTAANRQRCQQQYRRDPGICHFGQQPNRAAEDDDGGPAAQ